MNLDLKGKVVLISGGAGDIGENIAEAFTKQGSNVIIGDIDYSKAKKIAEKLSNNGRYNVLSISLDVTSEKSIEEVVKFIQKYFGQLNILVNVAGILCRKSFFDSTKKDFKKSVNINVIGAFLVSKESAKLMIKNKSGAIINISSINGTSAIENRCIYGTTKAGLNLLTKSMALELSPYGINVNAVAPGVVDSKMARVRLNSKELRKKYAKNIPVNRLALPEDVANCVLFLSSPYASYINGEVILVDGGIAARQALPKAKIKISNFD